MTPTRSRRKAVNDRRARVILVCGFLFFVIGQVAFRWVIAKQPVIADREFGQKLLDLKAKTAANPDKPLAVMLGSSRVATGFRPDLLENANLACFNFAQVGTGPQLSHLVLERMLKQGIKPDWVFIEFWPPFWGIDGYLNGYIDSLNLAALDWSDVQVLARYLPRPRQLIDRWIPAQLAPVFSSRFVLLSRLGAAWAPKFDADRRLQNLNADGWWTPRASVTPEERAKLVEHYRGVYAQRLSQFRVRPTPERALKDILNLCRAQSIKVAVVVLPEGKDFQALYPPEAREAVDAYLDRLATHTTVIDARNWVEDDGFSDGHHLLPAGAEAFTTRLARVAVHPILQKNAPAVATRTGVIR